MFSIRNTDKNFFNKTGYLLKSVFNDNEKYFNYSKELHQELKKIQNNRFLEKLGGYKSGNLNIELGHYSEKFLDLFFKKNLKVFFEDITGEHIDDYEIKTGGNLNLPDSKNQFFHTDGNWYPRMIIFNFATIDINLNNGPIEILEGSHKMEYPYWKFLLKKKDFLSKKITMNKGDILIREHRLWHRGTKNFSNSSREMIGILFVKKLYKEKTKKKFSDLRVYENMYENNFKGRVKEFIFLNFKFLLVFYKIIISIKN